MKRVLEHQAGFTLMELMIALFVLSLVIAGYIGANVKAQQNTEYMHERTIAIQDANRIIEQMRYVSRTGTFPDNVVAEYPQNSTPGGFQNLPRETITISYASTTSNPLDVTVTVGWLSYTGRTNSETLRTYITQR
jgi:prepilin-type N-terminal cleavage/methylation domain-containing protein